MFSILCWFLRFDELSHLKAHDLTFHRDYVDIFMAKSKTDCYRHGKNVLIAKLESPCCPVSILQRYISQAEIGLGSDIYLF